MSFSKIVLARYRENIMWAVNKYHNKCIIYDKGNNLKAENCTIIPRSNRPDYGRESETYLYHIISNYDNLDDYTIFSQGDPFKHSPKFLEILDYLDNTNTWKKFQPLSCMWLPGSEVPPQAYIKYDKTAYVGEYPIYLDTIDSHFEPLFCPDYGVMPTLLRFRQIHRLNITDKILPYVAKHLNLEHKMTCDFIKFNFGALFGVSKDAILAHPKDFYEKLHTFCLRDWTHGYIMERLWYTIFS